MKANLLVIMGPTAVGKTQLAVNVARSINGEVISADSRQLFRGMDLGTGKDLAAYSINNEAVPHHLINILNAGEKYNVDRFKSDFFKAFADISARGKFPVLCGGTGMYIHSLLQAHDFTAIPVNEELRTRLSKLDKPALQECLAGYPSEFTAHADQSSAKRLVRAVEVADFMSKNTLEKTQWPALSPCVVCLNMDRAVLRENIYIRLHQRLKDGLVEEVKTLLYNGVSSEVLKFYGLEYKFIVMYLEGELTYEVMTARLFTAICQFAKRQVTFFKKMEKDGVQVHWLPADAGLDSITESVISLKENTVIAV